MLRRADFFGIDDPAFRGGVTVAAADLDGDGAKELIVAAGTGGGPRVALYAGKTLFDRYAVSGPPKLMDDFFAFGGDDAARLRNGVTVAPADLNGDGTEDLVFGPGRGGAPRVFAVDGRQLVDAGALVPLASFFVGGHAEDRGGVQLLTRDLDGDGRPELVASAVGSSAPSTDPGGLAPSAVYLYDGRALVAPPGAEPLLVNEFEAFGGADGAGVYVG